MTQETNNNVVKSLPQSTSSSSSSSGTKTKQNVYNKNEKNKNNENNEKRKSTTTTTRSSHRVPKPEFMTRVSHLFDDLFLIFLLNFENFFHRLLFVNYHRQ